ncbi:MAG: chromate transporter [Oscillospiraceae bacterium]|nr:chromate transporter [Oscillospiraceae bacterium]
MMHVLPFLFYEFFFTGLFSIGGGLATIPFLQQMSARHGWLTQHELANMIAIAETAPGPHGTNMAAFVGKHVAGFPGAALAAFALMLPTMIIDTIIASMLDRFRQNRVKDALMRVLRPTSAGLIAAAVVVFLQIALASMDANWALRNIAAWAGYFDWWAVGLFVVLLALLFTPKIKKIHPAAFIAVGAGAGIALGLG